MNSSPQPQHNPPKHRLGVILGVVMVSIGALLLIAAGGYYAYSINARSQLDDLNFAVAEPTLDSAASLRPTPIAPKGAQNDTLIQSPPTPQTAQPTPSDKPNAAQSSGTPDANPMPTHTSAPPPTTAPIPDATSPHNPTSSPAPTDDTRSPPLTASYASLYPATHIHPKFWAQPLWSDGIPYQFDPTNTASHLPDGFRAISAADEISGPGEGSLSKRIAIPLIGVDSIVAELAILNIGDSRSYETPKNLVGHIPQSPNAGEMGNAWYFGHLESPVKGEGNVFKRLPEIPNLLRDGDDVFVEVESHGGQIFLYKVTRTEVVPQNDLHLYGSQGAQITLVACVPRLVYDHRILVTATLVGVKDIQPTH